MSARSKVPPASFSFLAGPELTKDAALGRINKITVRPKDALRLKTARVGQRLDNHCENAFPCLRNKRRFRGHNFSVSKFSVSRWSVSHHLKLQPPRTWRTPWPVGRLVNARGKPLRFSDNIDDQSYSLVYHQMMRSRPDTIKMARIIRLKTCSLA